MCRPRLRARVLLQVAAGERHRRVPCRRSDLLARNPLVLFVLAPLFVFVIRQRLASSNVNRRERRSVWLMNLAILCVAAVLS